MYVPTQPFSPNGVAPANLTAALTRINANDIKVTDLKVIECYGDTGCVVPSSNGTFMATSALDMTHAQCQGNITSETGTTRYTGICKREIVRHSYDLADAFLTECKSNRKDFILINYNKDSTNFTTSGGARAFIGYVLQQDGLFQGFTQQSVDKPNQDVFVFCPGDFIP